MRRIRRLKNWSIGAKTLASHLAIAVVTIGVAVLLCYAFGQRYTHQRSQRELLRQAVAIAEIQGAGEEDDGSRIGLSRAYQRLTNAAVFFVERDGENVRMSKYVVDPVGEKFSSVELLDTIDRQFIDRILTGETVTAVRQFSFAGGEIVFAGAPVINRDGAVTGGVILAQPVEVVRAIRRALGRWLLLAADIAIVLAILFSIALTRMLVSPLQRMTRAARRMSEGDYAQRIRISTRDEIGDLGETLNMLSRRLAETIASLRGERDRLEMVIGSLREGILALDGEKNIVHCNQSFLALTELSEPGGLFANPRKDVQPLAAALEEALSVREDRRLTWTTPDGRSVLAQITALRDEEAPIGLICLLADVSETLRQEQLQRDYIANISHELRTPLTGIRGMIEPLMDGYAETEEERQEYYAVIQRETIRLQKLVGELLDMSRLQDGRLEVELERMELNGVLAEAVRSMEPVAKTAGVSMQIDAEQVLWCMGNEDRIVQVMVILLDNAIGFTPAGGSVTVTAREGAKNMLEVSVRDTGCGIEPRDLPRIWERFYKADRSRTNRKSNGLGLSIARRVVELMGGEIRVESEPGCGAEFIFTLRRAG